MKDSKTVRLQSSRKLSIKRFFTETFRAHSKEEYIEVFSRGMAEQGCENVKYPWLYSRAFLLLLVLFALTALAYRIANYSVVYMTAMVIGGLTFNIPLLIFFFELYPKRDVSLLTLLFTVLVGGAVSSAVILLGYEFICDGHPNPWISYLWTGFWEELVKMLVAIPAVLLIKKKNPFACFLIGFAVGTGYSFFEDLGYILSYSRSFYSGNMWLVLMTVGRGFSCICSHAPWTAVICWAFAKFKKPFLNPKFYAVVISSMFLHYLADVPFYADEVAFLKGFNWGWAIEAFVVAAILAEMFLMLKNSFEESGTVREVYACTAAQKYAQTAHMWGAIGTFVLAVCALSGVALPIKYANKKVVLQDRYELISYMQGGDSSISADWSRKYDPEMYNHSEFTESGEVQVITQREFKDGYYYYYVYENADGELSLQSIAIGADGIGLSYCRRLYIYESFYLVNYGYPRTYEPITDNFFVIIDDDIASPDDDASSSEGDSEDDGTEIAVSKPLDVISYFPINADVTDVTYSGKNFTASLNELELSGLGYLIALSVVSGVTLVGCTAVFINLRLKSKNAAVLDSADKGDING